MKILNPVVTRDLEAGKPLRLDLGGGARARDGHVCLDQVEIPGVDIVADLNQPLDLLPDDCVERLYTRHVLEHVRELETLLREMHRITRPDGVIEILVPHFSNPYFYSDPTHVRFFGLYTMFYFTDPEDQPAFRKVPCHYSDLRFRVESVEIEFYRTNPLEKALMPLFARWINRGIREQDFYERRLSGILPAWQIRYGLRPRKDGSSGGA